MNRRAFVVTATAALVVVASPTAGIVQASAITQSSTAAAVTQAAGSTPKAAHAGPSFRGDVQVKSCDRSGDRIVAGDCVTHKLAGRAADHVVHRGEKIKITTTIHPSIKRRELRLAVQYALVNRKGNLSSNWFTTSTHKVPHGAKSFTVKTRGPAKMGNFALRTQVTAAHTTTRARSLGNFVATSQPTGIRASAGRPSQDDIMLVEYFNQIEFSGLIQIGINQMPYDQSNPFALTISCPEAVSLSVPGPDFRLTLETTDGIQSTTCASGQPIYLKSTQMANHQLATCTSSTTCNLWVIFDNRSTGTVYSQTTLPIVFEPGHWDSGGPTIIPQLMPATIPLPPPPAVQCILDNSCPFNPSNKKDAVIHLCDSSFSCVPGPRSVTSRKSPALG